MSDQGASLEGWLHMADLCKSMWGGVCPCAFPIAESEAWVSGGCDGQIESLAHLKMCLAGSGGFGVHQEILPSASNRQQVSVTGFPLVLSSSESSREPWVPHGLVGTASVTLVSTTGLCSVVAEPVAL